MLTRAAFLERVGLALAQLGAAPPPFPVPFYDAYLGLTAARTVMAASSTGLLAALAERPDDAAGLAHRCGLEADGVAIVLDALETLGYVRTRRGQHCLSRRARRWQARLAATTSALSEQNLRALDRLEDVLRGGPPAGLHDRPAGDPFWTGYERAMEELARFSADVLARELPLERPRRLLDLAGGTGTHAAALARRHPGLEATVVELPGAVTVVRERRPAPGVRHVEGDLFETELGEGYDAVTAYSILQNLPAERCAELLRRACAAVAPGGLVAVLELEQPGPGRAGTRTATLNSVAFWAYARTRCWTAGELSGFFAAAGLTEVEIRRPAALNGSVLALGRRPRG